MIDMIAAPIGFITARIFSFTSNYCITIIGLAFLARLCMFPIEYIVRKNALKLVLVENEIRRLKTGVSESEINNIQWGLYKKVGANPLFGLIPMGVQLVILFGVLQVVYNPLTYIFQLPKEVIEILRVDGPILLSELEVLSLGLVDGIKFNYGINLFGFSGWVVGFVILSTLGLSVVQSKCDLLFRVKSLKYQIIVSTVMVALFGGFAFIVPSVLGIYWIALNIFASASLVIINFIRSKHECEALKIGLDSDIEQLKDGVAFELDSVKRFKEYGPKEIVVYSQGPGYWQYFKGTVEYILSNSDIYIHYVTTRFSESPLQGHENFKFYYISEIRCIGLMMELEADIVLMTTPELGNYYIKRSLIKKDINYVFIEHGVTSFHLTYSRNALRHYDTVLCCAPNHITELEEMEKVYRFKKRKAVPVGYTLLDELIENYLSKDKIELSIIIAPSWNKDNILDSCIDEILVEIQKLEWKDLRIKIRPHPEYIKRYPDKLKAIVARCSSDKVYIQQDFPPVSEIYESDILITDWSSIAVEYAYVSKKPVIFINTPMKVVNKDYKKISQVPYDIYLRDRIGIALDLVDISKLSGVIKDILENGDKYRDRISEELFKNIFNLGKSAEVGGNYLIQEFVRSKIVAVMDCIEEDITDIERVKGGMTNSSYKFRYKDKDLIIRLPGVGSSKLINRVEEKAVYDAIKGLDLGDEVYFISAASGLKLSKFYPNARTCDPYNFDEVEKCLDSLKRVHESGVRVPHKLDLLEKMRGYRDDILQLSLDINKFKLSDEYNLCESLGALNEFEIEPTLVHLDSVSTNFLIYNEGGKERIRLLDWEYATMADPDIDIAMFIVYSDYTKDQVDGILARYFKDEFEAKRRKLYLYIAGCGLLWGYWCEVKELSGQDLGDYKHQQYKYAFDFYNYYLEIGVD